MNNRYTAMYYAAAGAIIVVASVLGGCNTVREVASDTPVAATQDDPDSQEIPELPVIYFEVGSTSLDPGARRLVREMAMVVLEEPWRGKDVIIEGHSDTKGSKEGNLVLSRRRAEAVAQELVLNGVSRSRIRVEAYGENRPVVPEVSADGTYSREAATANRRVEAFIEAKNMATRKVNP